MIAVTELNNASQRVIDSLKKHLTTGYEKDREAIEGIEHALRQGKIRLVRFNDDTASFEDLAGDCFNPEVNEGIPAEQLKREEVNFKTRIRRAGKWAYQSQMWTGRDWVVSDTIGGFVGWDFMGSGYELQVMQEALEAYHQQLLNAEGFVVDPYLRAA